jgi:serine phosphatase RsbU (regulator of sigma subunit)
VALSSAAGGTFGGDFLVCRVSNDEGLLEVAMVDVSGKGVDAGTRALLLAGAVGGMLGSVPPDRFLGAANDFLLGLGWEEGFATAIHLALELPSGSFRLNAAGHVPAAHFVAGRGEWRLVEPAGPALGLLPDAQYVPVTGDLRASDALLLYTDGVIEVPGRDLAVGIDKLLGEAERQVPRGFDGAASRLLSVASVAIDDRAIFLIWRT